MHEVCAPEGAVRLMNRVLSDQLRGTLECEWCAEGVIIRLNLSKERLAM
jgi:hypothetical protein